MYTILDVYNNELTISIGDIITVHDSMLAQKTL